MKPQELDNLLKDVSAQDLMYYIYSMRNDVHVVQWYSPEHIKEMTETDTSIETIKDNWGQIQEYLSCQWMLDRCTEHVSEMSSYSEDWGLEELFPDDESEEE